MGKIKTTHLALLLPELGNNAVENNVEQNIIKRYSIL